VKYFNPEDFKCPCKRPDCDAPPMKEAFLLKLDRLGEIWWERHQRYLIVTSGSRCAVHNADPKVKGAAMSEHLFGNAADLDTDTKAEVDELREIAAQVGMGGIGSSLTGRMIHVDDGGKGRRWTYP
jgi:uncharacterized protein YcbK (DUF882 family)